MSRAKPFPIITSFLGLRRQTDISIASKTISFAKVDFIDQPMIFCE